MKTKQRLVLIRRLENLIKVYSVTRFPNVIFNHTANITTGSIVLSGILLNYFEYSLLVALLAFVFINIFTPKKTFNQRVYELLIAYEPTNKDQYYSFIKKIEADKATFEDLRDWMDIERKNLFQPPEGEAIAKAELLRKIK